MTCPTTPGAFADACVPVGCPCGCHEYPDFKHFVPCCDEPPARDTTPVRRDDG